MEDEAAKGERKRLLAGMERLPRDFLRRFVGNGYPDEPTDATEGDSDEIELSLGLSLSLGGCFGVDPKGKKLVRSSSTASFSSLPSEPEFPVVAAAALTRTSSLPAEIEEEQRKRKEMQSLKRLEAKRKRLERRNSIRWGPAKAGEKSDEDVNGGRGSTMAAEQMMFDNGQLGLPGGGHYRAARNGVIPPGLPAWAAVSKRPAAQPADMPESFRPAPISQGSIGSQGSSSASACNIGGRAAQGFDIAGFSSCTETRSVHNHIHNNATGTASSVSGVGKAQTTHGGDEDISKQVFARANGLKEMERKMMEKMPYVSTKGDGPNGKRIEGFLYKYSKGEEVRIVCVCHGSFLTPAEFVKHAGGGDVTNPLRHIVVNSSPFSLL